MMKKVLVANRGEIALRVFRSCKQRNIKTVALYTHEEAHAPYVESADEAVLLEGESLAETFLDIDKIIALAKNTGADSIHPGYGFLAENPAFAEAVAASGLTFIGPDATSMRKLGLKDSAKLVAQAAHVPTIPGYQGEDQSEQRLIKEAKQIGCPLLIKARAGGGGKGMRRVERSEDMAVAIASAKRESLAGFGDEGLILEKLVAPARHVEVQVIADHFGNALHFFERDCSIQRRHQKLLEESPCEPLSVEQREQICSAATAVVLEAGLTNAATVEFLVTLNPFAFYFLEVNTRIQVEHPVTEEVTGVDLINLQLDVAAGEKLPLTQDEISLSGHAIEARVYAESPAAGFAPRTGSLSLVVFPEGEGLRVEHGLAAGMSITGSFDPMLAKIIANGATRAEAIQRLASAIENTYLVGVTTNLDYLKQVLALESFVADTHSISYLDGAHSSLVEQLQAPERSLKAAAIMRVVIQVLPALLTKEHSPFFGRFEEKVRLGQATRTFHVTQRGAELHGIYSTRLSQVAGSTFKVQVNEEEFEIKVDSLVDNMHLFLTLNGEPEHWFFPTELPEVYLGAPLICCSQGTEFEIRSAAALKTENEAGSEHQMRAHLPGTIIAIASQTGDTVGPGTPIIVIESMKMEHSLCSASESVVAEILVKPGDKVQEGQLLLTFEQA